MSKHKHQCGLITVDMHGNTELLADVGCGHVWEHEPQARDTLPEKVCRHLCPNCGLGPWYAEYKPASGLKRVVALLALATLQACATVPSPNACFVNYDHVSHPLQGQPFGPKTEEGTIDSIGGTCRWEKGRVFIESGLSYMWPDSDLYGDDLLFNSRVAYKIWERQ